MLSNWQLSENQRDAKEQQVDETLFVIDPEIVAIYKKRGEEICEEVLKETAWEKAKKVNNSS